MTDEIKPGGFSKGFRENVEAIVVAFTFALIIRCFFLEVFQIPTTSMEPTLLGDVQDGKHHGQTCHFVDYHGNSDEVNATGDRIMVTKFYYGIAPIERYDVIVFKYPLNIARNFIKRIVGMPDEEFLIHQGNIYTAPGEGNDPDKLRITRKPQAVQSRLWIRADKGDYLLKQKDFEELWHPLESAGQDVMATFTVRDGVLKTIEHNQSRKSLFRHYQVRDYEQSYSGTEEVSDLRLRLKVELDDPNGSFLMKIENRYGTFEFNFSGRGSEFTFKDTTENARTDKLSAVPQKERVHLLELEVYDGQYFVKVDGENLITQKNEFITTLADAKRDPRRSTEISFGSKDTTFEVSHLRLDRDIHYRTRGSSDSNLEEDVKKYIPPKQYIVLGDNTDSSHDSRAWQKFTVTLKDGRKIEFERKAIEDGTTDDTLKYFVKEDRYGNAVPITKEDYVDEDHKEFFTVGEQYIVGRALWVWWPLNRAGRLIR